MGTQANLEMMRSVLRKMNKQGRKQHNWHMRRGTTTEEVLSGKAKAQGNLYLEPDRHLPPDGLGVDFIMKLNGAE